MPVIKSAIKKVRKDKVRTLRNQKRKDSLKSLIKKVRVSKSTASLKEAFSALDKAAKVNLIHKNKASRLKSRLSKMVAQPAVTSEKKASNPRKKK